MAKGSTAKAIMVKDNMIRPNMAKVRCSNSNKAKVAKGANASTARVVVAEAA